MKLFIYNLEFTEYREEMTIGGFTFKRVADYENKVNLLSRHYPNYIGEFELSTSTGEHVITATVEDTSNGALSPLAYGAPQPILEDVLLILSLFTGREVFSSPNNEPIGIKRDFRPYLAYDTLGVSIPPNLIRNDRGMPVNIGFEEGLDRVLQTIHSSTWLDKFERGVVLFIARQVFIFQILEKAFLMSYVLWEHVFFIENKSILTPKQFQSTDGAQKIRHLLERYGLTPTLNGQQKDNIYKSLTRTRNNYVHYGSFQLRGGSNFDAIQFVELTTRLVAIILGLEASDGKNTQRWLEEMTNRN